MPRRKGLSRAGLVQAAVRAAGASERPDSVPVPRRRRPMVVLRVDKPVPGGPVARVSGVVASEGGLLTLYCGRDWLPEPGSTAPIAERFLGEPVLVISGTTRVATERARRRLRQAWKLADVIASGRLGEAPTATMRAALDRM